MNKEGFWALTTEFNEYNQHGSTLCCAWTKKPGVKELAEYFRHNTGQPGNVMEALAFILHIQNGGGRQQVEDQWWNLTFINFGERIEN